MSLTAEYLDNLKRGTRHELEHTASRAKARKIAEDHLREHPDYYDWLEAMEAAMENARRHRGMLRDLTGRKNPSRMDYTTAKAAAMDAANRQAKANRRKEWSRDDYNLACRTLARLHPASGANRYAGLVKRNKI